MTYFGLFGASGIVTPQEGNNELGDPWLPEAAMLGRQYFWQGPQLGRPANGRVSEKREEVSEHQSLPGEPVAHNYGLL